MAEVIVAFDIYGTLLSFETATHELSQHLQADAERARTDTISPSTKSPETLCSTHSTTPDPSPASRRSTACSRPTIDRLQPSPDVEDALQKNRSHADPTGGLFHRDRGDGAAPVCATPHRRRYGR
ncbi:hypothetical protein BP00DRAFT_461511 [Aspergillus indologenus CBS 114.80]|uniref:HAD-like protein n=1 Tax=Aspergillus indologenus CBS 114.80 TaxID=1450541 RepID=A0A2V5HW28_9EURO|nr:hypothetical protein BP00DRAFT_461511 [Aspergillus indologenus CBS 114.80]